MTIEDIALQMTPGIGVKAPCTCAEYSATHGAFSRRHPRSWP